MRILVVIAINVIVLGGLTAYMQLRDMGRPPAPDVVEETAAKDTYALEVVATFSAEPDPFDLTVDEEKSPVLLVRLRGRDVIRIAENLPAGETVRARDVEGLVVGKNEFYLSAKPPLSAGNQAHAVRVRVLRNGNPIAEKTFWSEPGSPVSATFSLSIEPHTTHNRHGHDHL